MGLTGKPGEKVRRRVTARDTWLHHNEWLNASIGLQSARRRSIADDGPSVAPPLSHFTVEQGAVSVYTLSRGGNSGCGERLTRFTSFVLLCRNCSLSPSTWQGSAGQDGPPGAPGDQVLRWPLHSIICKCITLMLAMWGVSRG